MQLKCPSKLVVTSFLCLLLVACGNMDVKKTYETDVVGLTKPSTVLIYEQFYCKNFELFLYSEIYKIVMNNEVISLK